MDLVLLALLSFYISDSAWSSETTNGSLLEALSSTPANLYSTLSLNTSEFETSIEDNHTGISSENTAWNSSSTSTLSVSSTTSTTTTTTTTWPPSSTLSLSTNSSTSAPLSREMTETSTVTARPSDVFSYEALRHRCLSEYSEGIWWNETCGGVIAARYCPFGYVGSAFRMCFYGGDWGQVDASECRVTQLIHLKHMVYYHVHKNLTRGFHNLAEELLRMLHSYRLHSLDDVMEALDILSILLGARLRLDLVLSVDNKFVHTLLEIGDHLFTHEEQGWSPPQSQQDQVTMKMVQVLHRMRYLSVMVADGIKRAGYKLYQVDGLPHTGLIAQVTDPKHDYVFISHQGNQSDDGERIIIPNVGSMPRYVFVTLWYRGFQHRLEDSDTLVNSAILSSSVHPGRNYRSSSPVTVVFKTRQIWDPSAFRLECSYLLKTDNRSNLWSSSGCKAMAVKDRQVTCQCHQVNNMAVILRRIHHHPMKPRPDAVNVVVLIGCCLALASLLGAFVAHAHLLRTDAVESTLILFNLVISMATTQIVFMAGIQATENQEVCAGVSIVLHYLHLVTLFWLLSHGIHVYLRLRQGPDAPPSARHMRDYCLLSWIVPVIFVVLTFIVNPKGYETRRYCWLSIERGMLLSFIVPVSSLIMINTTLMVLALKHFFEVRAITRKADIERVRIAMRMGVVLLPLFGVNWFVGVLALEDTSTYVFEGAFAITNSLQGFLVFFFNCIMNTEIRHSIWRRCCFRRRQRKSLDMRMRRSRKRQRKVDAEPLLVKMDEALMSRSPPLPVMPKPPEESIAQAVAS